MKCSRAPSEGADSAVAWLCAVPGWPWTEGHRLAFVVRASISAMIEVMSPGAANCLPSGNGAAYFICLALTEILPRAFEENARGTNTREHTFVKIARAVFPNAAHFSSAMNIWGTQVTAVNVKRPRFTACISSC